jgi:hypothetical protein
MTKKITLKEKRKFFVIFRYSDSYPFFNPPPPPMMPLHQHARSINEVDSLKIPIIGNRGFLKT